MTRRARVSALAAFCLLVGGCLPPQGPPLPVPGGAFRFAPLAAHLSRSAPDPAGSGTIAAPDTLLMTASWTPPAEDGRGPIDSLRIRFVGIFNDTAYTFRLPFPVTQGRSHVIPATAYSGASATFDVWAEATTYRAGMTVGPVRSAVVQIVLLGAAPPPVGGFTFTATKRP